MTAACVVCGADSTRGTRLCEDDYRAALDRLREEMKRPARVKAIKPAAPVTVTRLPGFEPKPAPKPASPPKLATGKRPKPERAAEMARAVHAAQGGHLTREAAAEAAGLTGTAGSFVRVLKHAVEAGWVRTTRRDGGGIVAGKAHPPAEDDQSRHATASTRPPTCRDRPSRLPPVPGRARSVQ